jgi:hypothetical protein
MSAPATTSALLRSDILYLQHVGTLQITDKFRPQFVEMCANRHWTELCTQNYQVPSVTLTGSLFIVFNFRRISFHNWVSISPFSYFMTPNRITLSAKDNGEEMVYVFQIAIKLFFGSKLEDTGSQALMK